MSLKLVATLTAKPGSESTVEDALRALAAASREEQGCQSYELYRSGADETAFITVEHWDDQAALDAHMQTEHVAAAFAAAGDHLAAPPAFHPLRPVEV